MKLKDIVTSCLKNKNGVFEHKYYWVIDGLTYGIDSFQSYCPSQMLEHNDSSYHKFAHGIYDSFINLSRYNFVNPHETQNKYDARKNYLTLNLNNEITIYNNFIMVHKTENETTDSESYIFCKTNYYIANGHSASAAQYNIGLFHTDPVLGGMATNLRSLFKDLVDPPVQPKPADLTLDEKVDDLIDELMKDSRTMAIKQLKRMLNERLSN